MIKFNMNKFGKWQWSIVALAVLVIVYWRMGRPSVNSRLEQAANDSSLAVAAVSSASIEPSLRIREILPSGYTGPMIEFHFRDLKGMRLTLQNVDIQSISNPDGGGGMWSLDDGTGGSQGLRTAFVAGKATEHRQIRADNDYYALQPSPRPYAPGFLDTARFRTPRYDPSVPVQVMDVTIPELPQPPGSAEPPKPPAFTLTGTLPNLGLSSDVPLALLYVSGEPDASGRRKTAKLPLIHPKPGDSFSLGVSKLGGDLLFSDIDMRVIYGYVSSVEKERVSGVEVLRGHKNYNLARSKGGPPEMALFYTMDQDRIPMACAVFPPGVLATSVKIPPGKYRMRIADAADPAIAANPLRQIDFGEQSTVTVPES
jgi:hypothetical protein